MLYFVKEIKLVVFRTIVIYINTIDLPQYVKIISINKQIKFFVNIYFKKCMQSI